MRAQFPLLLLEPEETRTSVASKQTCRQCKNKNPPEARFCFSCGASLAPPVPYDGLLANDTILRGTYVIEDVLGEGGMGVVYKARHHTLGSPYAIKVLDSKLARVGSLRERFLEEARIQATLTHPNIVRVHDILDEEGVFGMVMEYIEGRTLDVYIHDECGQVELDEARRISISILDAIGHAHRAGVIHRDLKPSNIMLLHGHNPDDIGGSLKVMDFGIAKVLDDDGGRTVTGAKMGTPRYMAPEQVKNARKVDARADIYAIGLTLYEMVTGRNPYEELRDYDLLQAQVDKAPPRPSRFRRGLPPEFESIILKALQKKPSKRIQDADEFISKLEKLGRFPSGTAPTKPPEDTPPSRAHQRSQREEEEDEAGDSSRAEPSKEPKKEPGKKPREDSRDREPEEESVSSEPPPKERSQREPKSRADEWSFADEPGPHGETDNSDLWDESYYDEPGGSRTWLWIAGIVLALGAVVLVYRFLGGDDANASKHEPLTEEQAQGRQDDNVSDHESPSPVKSAVETVRTPSGMMSTVKAGEHLIGELEEDGGNPRTVTLPAFQIDQTEVTVHHYQRCVSEEVCPPLREDQTGPLNAPVTGIGYGSAAAYCRWAGKRLPTEEEWEAAARTFQNSTYPSEEPPSCRTVNFGTGHGGECVGANPGKPESVYNRPMSGNALHTHHMAGNVWEWTSTQATDRQSRIAKGGSFRSPLSDLKVSARRAVRANTGDVDVGFRCVKDAP